MHRMLISVLVSLCSLTATAHGATQTSANEESRGQITSTQIKLVRANNTFGFKLFQEIVNRQKDKNVVLSPFSIAAALAMVYNGADGATKDSMQQTLELTGLTLDQINSSYESLAPFLTELDPAIQFQTANSVWCRQTFTPSKEFLAVVHQYFDSHIQSLNFHDVEAAKKIINGWVRQNTNGKIKDIIYNIPPQAMMYLINAVYFKGSWTNPFDSMFTRDDWFFQPDGSKDSCKMMNYHGELLYYADSSIQAVDLPYGNGQYSMTIFLPREECDIDSLIGEFDQQHWDHWTGGFDQNSGALSLPKFRLELEYESDFEDALKALGMGIAFDGRANFNKMCAGNACDLYIGQAKHKTFIRVDEEGTEAAAVTSIRMDKCIVMGHLNIRVNRPFLFAIREKSSGAILFLGRVMEPVWD